MHKGQFRHSSKPYFTHPVAITHILTLQQINNTTLVTALLHDTIENTKTSFAMVETQFGRKITKLINNITKLTNLQLTSTQTKQTENFHKLFITTNHNLRMTLVKLANHLHNMHTIKSMHPKKQAQKTRKTMEIFTPLASRINIQ